MLSRREFIQMAAVTGTMLGGLGNWNRLAAQQKMNMDDLLKFDAKGQVTLLPPQTAYPSLEPTGRVADQAPEDRSHQE